MKEIIYDFSCSKARNAQHVQFATDLLAAIPEETATTQGFAAQRAAFATAATNEQLCFRPDKGYLDTPEIEAADSKRDNLFLLYSHIFQAFADYSPETSKQQAGQTLTFAFREAGQAARLDYASETAVLTDLVGRLRTEPYSAALTTLGFDDAPDELETANDAFNALYLKRAAEEKSRALGMKMKDLRPLTDAAFVTLAKAINALYAVNEMVTDDAEKRTALGALIDEVNTIVVRFRKTIGSSASTSSGSEEQPGELDPVDPGETEEPETPEEGGGERPGGL